MTKKQKIKLILSGAELLLALIVVTMAITSMAWYATNKQLTGTGMTVQMTANGALVLYENEHSVQLRYENPQEYLTRVFHHDIAQLEPATHDNNSALYPSQLKYVTNNDVVSPITGMSDSVSGFQYAEAVVNRHYVDFTVYLSSMGADLSFGEFSIEIKNDSIYQHCENGTTAKAGTTYYSRDKEVFSEASVSVGDDVSDLYSREITGAYRATCVDVYYNASYNGIQFTEDDAFLGTMRLSKSGSWKIVIAQNGTVAAFQPLRVTLRCYFDGEMTETGTGGNAIIRAANQKTGDIFFGVSFNLTPRE